MEGAMLAAEDNGLSVRLGCRRGDIKGSTSGFAAGYEQANVIVLPKEMAYLFVTYCIRNPKPCPLLDVTEPGNPCPRMLGKDADVRTDIPKYLVHTRKQKVEKMNIVNEWESDSVATFLGCSFSFEAALVKEGIPLRHVEERVTVPMYITNRHTVPSGPFHGPLVVSMRPIRADLVSKTIEITRQYPRAHGAPVHVGDPSVLGICHLNQPDFGDPVTVHKDEVPVFWACGVTSQMAMQNAGLDKWISHVPGCMFVTDMLCNQNPKEA